MHPTIRDYLTQAQLADRHCNAEQDQLAQRARTARHPRRQRAGHPAPGHPALLLVRRALAAHGGQSL
jgi:hypothetical protein